MTTERKVLRGAGYIRMSTDEQCKSPDRQRADILSVAKREQVDIARWYDQDEGIYGDSGPDVRPDFGRLLQDSTTDAFDCVVCSDTSRVGRFDLIGVGRWLHPLQDNEVRILSAAEGWFDLNNAMDRMRLGMQAEQANGENVKRAWQVLSGMQRVADRGFSCGGRGAYGVGRAEYKPDGTLVRVLGPNEVKGSRDTYVGPMITDDEAQRECILYCFERFDGADISPRKLAAELRSRGYPTPGRVPWENQHVLTILECPIYAGMVVWARGTQGKYYSLDGEELKPRARKAKGTRERKPDDKAILRPAPYLQPLIDPALFRRVQAKLTKRSKLGSKSKRREHPLSGLVVCGGCDLAMHFTTYKVKSYKYRRFRCTSHERFGNEAKCGHNIVDADRLLAWLVEQVRGILMGPARLDLLAEIRRQLKAENKGGGNEARKLVQRIAKLDEEAGNIRQAIIRHYDDELNEVLQAKKRERERLAAELARVGRFAAESDIDREAERIADLAQNLGERLGDSDPETLREVLVQLVERIECRFEQRTTTGGKVRATLAGGVVFGTDLLRVMSCGVID